MNKLKEGCASWKLFVSLSIYSLLVSPIPLPICFTLVIVGDVSCSPIAVCYCILRNAFGSWEWLPGAVPGPADTLPLRGAGAAQPQWQADRPGHQLQPVLAHGCQGSSPPGNRQPGPRRPQGTSQRCCRHLFSFPGKCRAPLQGLRAKPDRPGRLILASASQPVCKSGCHWKEESYCVAGHAHDSNHVPLAGETKHRFKSGLCSSARLWGLQLSNPWVALLFTKCGFHTHTGR